MEMNSAEIAVVREVIDESASKDAQMLVDLQLVLNGGGRAAVVFG